MLSYIVPSVEEKSPVATVARNLSLNLNSTTNGDTNHQNNHQQNNQDYDDMIDENTKLLDNTNGGANHHKVTTKSDKNFNNVILVNGNGNVKLSSVLKNSAKSNIYHNYSAVNSDECEPLDCIDNICYVKNAMNQSASVNKNLSGINGNGNLIGGSNINTPSSGAGIVDSSISDADSMVTNPDSRKVKMNKLGNKNVTLKRVSFGSSKGSMVETLVFETPTPLPEHAERQFFHSPAMMGGAGTTTTTVNSNVGKHSTYDSHNNVGLDDSGIELQEEVERSKVRVSFFQSSKPQQISPPESLLFNNNNNNLINFGGGCDNNNSIIDSYITSASLNQQYDTFHHNYIEDPNMAAVLGSQPVSYDRQISSESGWDNPFRPGGDLSREADEIVNLIKGGKPITPTGEQTLLNGSLPKETHVTENGTTVIDGVATKIDASQLQSTQNGTSSPNKQNGAEPASPTKNGSTNATQVSNQVIPGPQNASHVVIDEKKKKKCACCVIQ